MIKPMINQQLIGKILKSLVFKRLLGSAPKYAKSADAILKLVKQSINKTQGMGVNGLIDNIREHVVLIGQMLKAYAAGEYKLENSTLIKLIVVLLYFISPIDLIPDFLPVLGFTDDLALLAWAINSLSDEMNRFRRTKKYNI
jgi:uncharacterized membrane protein YkvA (DUF1232 family)